MRCKKFLSMFWAVAMVCTAIPAGAVLGAGADVDAEERSVENPALESHFELVFDESTGAVSSMKLDNDPNKGNADLELNWVNGSKNTSGNGVDFGDTTWGMGPLYNSYSPTALSITETKSEAQFDADGTRVQIIRELADDSRALEETYTFTNTSEEEQTYEEGELGIYVPFNDLYEESRLSTERRCNTHIWAGKDYSYIYAVRMGGNGPHVGLALTQGSMESYGQVGYARSNSNDRGKFIFNNAAMTLEPDESYTVAWRVFVHDGEQDFYQKLDELQDFVRLEADCYTKESEKKEAFSITAVSSVSLEGASLRARKVGYRNKADVSEFPESDAYSPVYGEAVDIPAQIDGNSLAAEFRPEEVGEYVVELATAEGKQAVAKLNYVSSQDSLLKNRAVYILDHQQMLDASDADRYGGFFPYNTESGELELNNTSYDHSGARERLSMPIMLALYYQLTEDGALKERIKQSLELFWEYAKREIINTETGQCFDTINYGGGTREYNSPNYAWMCMEMYTVTGNEECVDVMMQILRYLRDTYGRRTAYIINMNMVENLGFLYQLGRYEDYKELYKYYVQCGDWIVEDLPNYPSLEVKYEQSIVSPTVENIAAVYYLTGDEKYKDAVEVHYRRMLSLEGNQPSYFQHKMGIRHWDDYWFGTDDNTCGDTLHYWSALDARALKMYDRCMGTDHTGDIKNIYANNLANIAEDGRGFCAYLIARQNNNIRGERYNKLANDQDYALAIALKNDILPQDDMHMQKKYVVTYNANNHWVKDQELFGIVEVNEGEEGAVISEFPDIDLENNRVVSWNTKKDGSGEEIKKGSIIRTSMTLYAQWEMPIKDFEGLALVNGRLAETSGTVNLAEEGSNDWVQFNSKNLADHAHKQKEDRLITNITALQGTRELATDGAFSYTNGDAADTAPKDGNAIVEKGLDSGFSFHLPANEKTQRLRVYAGVWAGDVTFELLVNGIVKYRGTFGKDTSSGSISQCFEVEYTVPNPLNTITGKLYCTKDLDKQWGGCSVLLQAITLGDSKNQIGEDIKDAIEQAEQEALAWKEKAGEEAKKAEDTKKELEAAMEEAAGTKKELEAARKETENVQQELEAARKETENARKDLEEVRKKAETLEQQIKIPAASESFQNKKASLQSAKSAKKKTLSVTWKKIEDAQGYIIEYSQKKNFKTANVIAVKKGLKTTVRKLQRGKKYYVRVCGYKIVNGEEIRTKYSGKKIVKVK